MTVDELDGSVAADGPPTGLGPALQALWWARKGEWQRAHGVVQQHEGEPDCDLVHAHLHRQEGDLANAAAWYRGVGRAMPQSELAEEWRVVVGELLGAE